VLPVNFWPAEIYAYYLPVPYRQNLMPVSVQTPDTAPRYLSEATFTECPLLLWSGHMTHEGVIQKAVTQLGMTRQEIVIHRLKGHLLILDEARLRK
jgi:hypothetical protein